MKRRSFYKLCALVAAGCLAAVSAGCGQETVISEAAVSLVNEEDLFTERDLNGEYDEDGCERIKLGSGDVTVTEEGVYILSGTLEEGMVIVDAPDSAKVQLVLDGVTVSNSEGAAIYVKEADKVFVTLAEGTTNVLTNGGSYAVIDDNHIDAVIFSKSDLVIGGTGSLNIDAKAGHGIVSKDDLKVTGGILAVTAAGHGLSGKDSVRIAAGSLTITAGKDGIHSENGEDTEKGFVYIGGGNIEILTCYEGIEGESVVISGGYIRVTASDDGLNAAGGKDSSGFGGTFGNRGGDFGSGGGAVLISGGQVYVNADGDGIDSNGTLAVTGGEVYVSGPVSTANSAIDYVSQGQITGGIVVAVGSAGMAMNFEGTSTQGSILTNNVKGEAGTEIVLKNAAGATLASYIAEKPFSSVVISCPELVVGGTYTLSVGGTDMEIIMDSLISGESFGGFGGQENFGDQGNFGDQENFGGQGGFGGQESFGDRGGFEGQGGFGGDEKPQRGEKPQDGEMPWDGEIHNQ